MAFLPENRLLADWFAVADPEPDFPLFSFPFQLSQVSRSQTPRRQGHANRAERPPGEKPENQPLSDEANRFTVRRSERRAEHVPGIEVDERSCSVQHLQRNNPACRNNEDEVQPQDCVESPFRPDGGEKRRRRHANDHEDRDQTHRDEQDRLDSAERTHHAEQWHTRQGEQQNLVNAAEELANDDVDRSQFRGQQVLQSTARLFIADTAQDESGGRDQDQNEVLNKKELDEIAADIGCVMLEVEERDLAKESGNREVENENDEPTGVYPAEDVFPGSPTPQKHFLVEQRANHSASRGW